MLNKLLPVAFGLSLSTSLLASQDGDEYQKTAFFEQLRCEVVNKPEGFYTDVFSVYANNELLLELMSVAPSKPIKAKAFAGLMQTESIKEVADPDDKALLIQNNYDANAVATGNKNGIHKVVVKNMSYNVILDLGGPFKDKQKVRTGKAYLDAHIVPAGDKPSKEALAADIRCDVVGYFRH